MKRIFLGLSIPAELTTKLVASQYKYEGIRWTKKENFHLTLCFIGNLGQDKIDDLKNTLDKFSFIPFDFVTANTDTFGNIEFPGIFYLGVEPSSPLKKLQQSMTGILTTLDIPFEERSFVPHITLARLKKVKRKDLFETLHRSEFSGNKVHVEKVHLYESISSMDGVKYRII